MDLAHPSVLSTSDDILVDSATSFNEWARSSAALSDAVLKNGLNRFLCNLGYE